MQFNPITQQQGIFVFRVEETIKLLRADSYQALSQISIRDNAGPVQTCQPLTPSPTKTEGSRLKVD